jgi:hypothetical protein
MLLHLGNSEAFQAKQPFFCLGAPRCVFSEPSKQMMISLTALFAIPVTSAIA